MHIKLVWTNFQNLSKQKKNEKWKRILKEQSIDLVKNRKDSSIWRQTCQKSYQRIASQKKQPRINFAMLERSSAPKTCNMSEFFWAGTLPKTNQQEPKRGWQGGFLLQNTA